MRVQAGGRAGRHQGRRVVLVDEERARARRRAEVPAGEHGRGQQSALAAEVGAARPAAAPPGSLASRTGAPAAGRTSRAVTRRLTTWIGSPAAACPYVRSCSRAKAAASASTPAGAAPLRRERDRQLERLALVLESMPRSIATVSPVALGPQEGLGLAPRARGARRPRPSAVSAESGRSTLRTR